MMANFEKVSVGSWSYGITASDSQNGNGIEEGAFAEMLKGENEKPSTVLLLERIKKYIEMHRNVFELNKSEWSVDYLNEFCDFMKSLDESHKVLSDLFRPVAKEDETTKLIGNRNVIDASEQLKADFGALLA